MKKLCTLLTLLFAFGLTYAQEKKELTREETVNYLKKKFGEVNEQWIVENNGSKQFITGLYIGNKDSELNITDRRKNKISNLSTSIDCGDWDKEQYYDFDPMQISDITDFALTNEQSLGYLQIKLSSKTAKYRMVFKVVETRAGDRWECNYSATRNDDRNFTEYIYIPYLKTDPTNFNKLKKAFEHLKKLSSQSDDPFGN